MLTFVLIGYWDNLDFGFLDTQTNTALTNELFETVCPKLLTFWIEFWDIISIYHRVREIFLQ